MSCLMIAHGLSDNYGYLIAYIHSIVTVQDGLRLSIFDDSKNELIELHQPQNMALEVKGLQEHVLVLTEFEYQVS